MTHVKKALPTLMVFSLALAGGSAASAPNAAAEKADPESPAAVEYEFPLDAARRRANGGADDQNRGGQDGRSNSGEGGDGSAEAAAPLFGEGISADGGPAGGGGAGAGDDATRKGESSKNNRADNAGSPSSGGDIRADASDPTRQGFSKTASIDEGSSDGALMTGGVSLAVLLLGGLTGLLVRRRSKRFGS